MANDRLWLRCRHCGEYGALAKYYPSLGHGIWSPESLDKFVWKHMECSPNFGQHDLAGDTCFTIHAESARDFVYRNHKPVTGIRGWMMRQCNVMRNWWR